jgi:hypothetical protein
MNKQKVPGIAAGVTVIEDRYYVQRLTEQVYLVRERKSVANEPGPDDRIVRSFNFRHDAYVYVGSVNDAQRKLDEQYGQWAQNAI